MNKEIISVIKKIYGNITDSSKDRFTSLLKILIKLDVYPIKMERSFVHDTIKNNDRQLRHIITDDFDIINHKTVVNSINVKHENPYIYDYLKALHSDGFLDVLLKKIHIPDNYINDIITSLKLNNIKDFNNTIDKVMYIIPSFLYYLFKLVNESNNTKMIDIVNKMNKKIKHIFKKIPISNKFYDNPFMSLENYWWIENNIVEYREVSYDDIILEIYGKNNIDDNYIKEIIRVVKMLKLLTKTNTKLFRCNIFLTDMKKYIDTTEVTLTNNQINTGSTVRGKNINIWRTEELQKVLFHELIHYIKYDIVENNDILRDKLLKKIKMCKWCSIIANESYVDCIAIIMNSIYNACKYVDKNGSSIEYMFTILFKIDIYYTLLQASTILYLNGYEKIEEIYEKEFEQYSNVMSYYIIKSSLLFNISDTLKFFSKSTEIFKFDGNISKIDSYYELINESLDNIYYRKTINDMIQYIKNDKDIKNKKISMRMTCIDMLK